MNGEEGFIERLDPDEPGRLIMKLVTRKGVAETKENRLKSLSYKNLTRLDGPASDDGGDNAQQAGTKRACLPAPGTDGTALQVLGAGGKRCKVTEVAIASGDKTAAFASAARNRDVAPSVACGAQSEASKSNALIYARTDAVS